MVVLSRMITFVEVTINNGINHGGHRHVIYISKPAKKRNDIQLVDLSPFPMFPSIVVRTGSGS